MSNVHVRIFCFALFEKKAENVISIIINSIIEKTMVDLDTAENIVSRFIRTYTNTDILSQMSGERNKKILIKAIVNITKGMEPTVRFIKDIRNKELSLWVS